MPLMPPPSPSCPFLPPILQLPYPHMEDVCLLERLILIFFLSSASAMSHNLLSHLLRCLLKQQISFYSARYSFLLVIDLMTYFWLHLLAFVTPCSLAYFPISAFSFMLNFLAFCLICLSVGTLAIIDCFTNFFRMLDFLEIL